VALILTDEQGQEISWLLGDLGGCVDHGMNILGEWTPEALELWERVVDARAILATADPEDRCPSCGAPLDAPGGPKRALSRVDNATHVCARCGDLEAMLDLHCGPTWRPAMDLHWRMAAATAQARAMLAEGGTATA
jgi:hypothetical protein